MKINEKQLQMLIQVLSDSLGIVGVESPFKFQAETRRNLAQEILQQQSTDLKDIE